MRRIFLLVLLIGVISWGVGSAQENIYGDHLLFTFDKRVSLDLEEAQLIDVLKMLSQQTKLNFVSTEAVRERLLTLYLEEVPLKRAMDIIFKANNLTYDYYPDANMFVVKEMGKPTIELKTKVYFLKYTRLESSKIFEEIDVQLKSVAITGSSSSTSSSSDDDDDEEGGQGIVDSVEQVLTEFGKIAEDPITNSLIVVDVPAQFPIIDEIVAQLDIAQPRILIEVEMLDVKKTHVDKMGFKFANGITGQFTPGTNTISTLFPWNVFDKALSGSTYTAGTLNFSNLTMMMKFLKQDTSTRILARPKLLTLANETAEVNLTTDEAIGLTTTNDTSGNTVTETVERAETGTKLRITPQVNIATGEITLYVDMFDRTAADSGLSTSTLTGDIQNVEERSVKTVLRIKQGETIYLGGLIKIKEGETITKIPLLGDIPFIGAFFRFKDKEATNNSERELLVFITPRILEEGNTSVASRTNVFEREQVDFSKRRALRLALDDFNH